MGGNFECSICNKTFSRQQNVLRHERIHTGAKPYKCPHCSQDFSRVDLMAAHSRKSHALSHRDAVQTDGNVALGERKLKSDQVAAARRLTTAPPPKKQIHHPKPQLLTYSPLLTQNTTNSVQSPPKSFYAPPSHDFAPTSIAGDLHPPNPLPSVLVQPSEQPPLPALFETSPSSSVNDDVFSPRTASPTQITTPSSPSMNAGQNMSPWFDMSAFNHPVSYDTSNTADVNNLNAPQYTNSSHAFLVSPFDFTNTYSPQLNFFTNPSLNQPQSYFPPPPSQMSNPPINNQFSCGFYSPDVRVEEKGNNIFF